MMYLLDRRGGRIRQVCFEQDHDYCPTVLNDGRVLYLRWDYTGYAARLESHLDVR